MIWAKLAIAGGLLFVAAGFALGVSPSSATVSGHSYGCGTVIPSSWLVAGTPDEPAPDPQTRLDRRIATACASVARRDRVLMWGALGVGGLAVLVGWTALRERGETAARAATPVHA